MFLPRRPLQHRFTVLVLVRSYLTAKQGDQLCKMLRRLFYTKMLFYLINRYCWMLLKTFYEVKEMFYEAAS